MPNQKKETKIQNNGLLAIGTMPNVLAWRQNVGLFRALHNPDQIVKCGIAGQGDIGLVVGCKITPDMVGRTIGVAVNAEYKTDTGRQSAQQKDWQTAFEKRGGVYRVVRSDDDLIGLVNDVADGRF